MHPPDLPIFLASDEDNDLMVAATVVAAEAEMEPQEVEEGYYVVFDSSGHIASLVIDRWTVKISGWSEEAHLSKLRRHCESYLKEHALLVDPSLDDLEFIREAARVIATSRRKMLHPRFPDWLRRLGEDQ